MDFDFSFEQRSLAEGVRRVLQSFPPVNETAPHAYRAVDILSALGEFGIFGGQDEASPLGCADLVAVAIEAGRTIVAAPVVETLAIASSFGATGADMVAAAHAAGRIVGVGMPGSIGDDAVVAHGASASSFVLPLRNGWMLASAGDVVVTPVETVDITADAARVRLQDGEAATMLAAAARPLDDLLLLGGLAEMAGAAAAMLERTVAYVGERKQFGKPVGSNQAIKHMAGDCAVAVETMKAAVEYAGWAADAAVDGDAEAEEARLALLSAASFVGEHARRVAEKCVQMHGGIAFTWDYGLHVPLRRILFRTAMTARPREAREALAAHLLDSGD